MKRHLKFLRRSMEIISRLNELTQVSITFVKRVVLPGALIALVVAFASTCYLTAVEEQLFRVTDQNKISSLTFVQSLREKEVGMADFTILGGDKPRRMMFLSRKPRVNTSPQYVSSPALSLYGTPDEGPLAANSDWRTPLQSRGLNAFDISEAMQGYDGQPGMGLMVPSGTYTIAIQDLAAKGGLVRAVVDDASMDGEDGRIVRARIRGRTAGEEHRLVLIFTVNGSGRTSVRIRARGPSLETPLAGILDAVTLEVRRYAPGFSRVVWASDLEWKKLSDFIQIGWTKEPTARLDLKAGHYVVIVRSRDGADGIAQIELSEQDPMEGELALN